MRANEFGERNSNTYPRSNFSLEAKDSDGEKRRERRRLTDAEKYLVDNRSDRDQEIRWDRVVAKRDKRSESPEETRKVSSDARGRGGREIPPERN